MLGVSLILWEFLLLLSVPVLLLLSALGAIFVRSSHLRDDVVVLLTLALVSFVHVSLLFLAVAAPDLNSMGLETKQDSQSWSLHLFVERLSFGTRVAHFLASVVVILVFVVIIVVTILALFLAFVLQFALEVFTHFNSVLFLLRKY
jgi:hypothetical protein